MKIITLTENGRKLDLRQTPKETEGMRLIWIAAFVAFLHCTVSGAGQQKQFYSERPDIATLKPGRSTSKTQSLLGKESQQLLRGHLEATSLLLELYPDRELVFLARDAELLYDAAVLLTQNDPQARGRLRLLNVSRTNVHSKSLLAYLEQEGISTTTLQAGKQILFVDTGFQGTLQKRIKSLFPKKYHKNFKSHLMCSSNPEHPSTRGFLTALNDRSLHRNPQLMKTMVEAYYEYLPHFTFQSTGIEKNPKTGKWDPVSERVLINAQDVISTVESQAVRAELVQYLNAPAQQALVKKRRAQVAQLRKAAFEEDSQRLKSEFQSILKQSPGDVFTESLVRDFLEAAKKNLHLRKTISLTSLGLKEIPEGGDSITNYHLLRKAYPQWKALLEKPERALAPLLSQGKYAEVETLSRVVLDDSFSEMLASQVGKVKETQGLKEFLLRLIDQNDPGIHEQLAMIAAPRFRKTEMNEVVEKLIEKGDAITLRNLVLYYFPKQKNQNKVDWMKRVLVRAKTLNKGELVQHAFVDYLTKIPTKRAEELRPFVLNPCLKPHFEQMLR